MKNLQKPSKKIRKGDKVIVIAGNFRGNTGNVISTDGLQAVVEGLNLRKRHMKKQGDKPGQIVQREYPIHISNLKPCTSDGRPVKLHVRENDQHERQLCYKEGDKEVVYRTIKNHKQ